ncbi:DUF445 domain-containing protein [Neisseria sp. Dent CA1/247]|uniref:Predicted membrane protein n=1 Tax=Neisseria zoodegmatis TaxID=326523 RepID=A0A1X3CS88_9NEIS|nr:MULTISPECIES: DUF445 domain-containing protein [Neisseria]OSI10619.1 twitching motility protein PilT [Neisseria zoodegmatis]UOO77781.1 DUF445 domain-containing protein [Neisseria sp. Dent CA1/247]SNU79583.1 Predicted membrane protein [Neisseria zoodegmatis]SUA36413.1 Predicted membrane protein [Neisseria zoodegmatis]
MHTLSAETRAQAARARLKKSRRWATGLLLAAGVLFVVSSLYVPQYPALGYVKAFAEAAMVGALADWFAVTALFRRPLGLPIPHTAILPRNQHRIADELGRFIENNFLQSKPIALRVYQAAPSEKLLARLADQRTRDYWLPWLAKQIPPLLDIAKPEQVSRFLSRLLAEQYSGERIGKTFSDGLKALKAQGMHETLFVAVLKQTRRWLQDPETRGLLERNLREWAARIESDAPTTWEKLKASLKGTLVDKVDGWVSEKALDWADGYLAAALADPDHRIRAAFDEQYDRVTDALSRSRLWHKRLEQGKMKLADSPAVQEMLMKSWQGLQKWAADDVEKSESLCLVQLNKLLDHMLSQAQKHPQFMRRADVRISLLVRDFVMRYKDKAALFVSDKVKAWDSTQMVEKLELSVGRDLQFIRINGTLVGGLVGLVIYSVSKWLF